MKEQSGFTLIEVMIALVILAAGLLALATMQIVSIRGNAFSSEMTYASMLAQSRFEQIQNMAYSAVTPGTTNEVVPAGPATKGISYTIQRQVQDNTPATNMKTVTFIVTWMGAPAGSATGDTSVQFRASFSTVIKL